MIICFTPCLCITKNEKFSAFCMNYIEVLNTFYFSLFPIKVSRKLFGFMPNGVVKVFFSLVPLLKRTWGLD